MKKITTLYKKDPSNLGRVINEINPENEWALHIGKATRKFDGTAMAVINGELYKRYDVKKGKAVPENAIPCQDADVITGHWPHWVKCNRDDKADKWAFQAWDLKDGKLPDGTYELVGPKVQGNPEQYIQHVLVPHGEEIVDLNPNTNLTFEDVKDFLRDEDIEGIVFHANDLSERMCKIRKSDFGFKR